MGPQIEMAFSTSSTLTVSDPDSAYTDIHMALSEYSYVRFTVVDICGASRGCLVPAKAARRFLKSGIGGYSGLIAFAPENELVFPREVVEGQMGNIYIKPDLASLHPIPWLSEKESSTAQFFCGTYWDEAANRPQEACPRGILTRLLGKLDEENLRICTGAEMEYCMRDKVTKEPVFQGPQYMSTLTLSLFHSWMTDVERNVSKAGVSIEKMHTEYSPGQFEFITAPTYDMAGIDSIVKLKQAIKEMSLQRGWEALFMAKFDLDKVGNALQFNVSLWDKEKENNVFWDADSPDKLSKLAKHWLAGLLHHGPALTALCCSTDNCYLRLHTPWTPTAATWGIQDRTAMFRVKNESPSATYMENRTSSGLANPYVVMAGMIAAGLDGIHRQLPCPEANAGPTLPRTLSEALEALQEDEIMTEALGKPFVEWFTMIKRDSELKGVEGITDKAELLKIHNEKYSNLH